MCGIFGASIKKGKKLDLKKIKTLGIYNIQRGTDSCGYYYSGNIVKGIDKEANFTKFIDKNEIVKGNLNGQVFMGHTRKSTFGAHTADNAHPHVVENYVQTHNGTLTKPWELCAEYDIEHKNITVDSVGLAHIIQKSGFEVLNKYKGYAALSMTFMDDSESLYLYHGASREKENGEVWEERPLYYLEQPEGIYYSSIEESLNFISVNKNKAQQLPHNCVYKIVNGEFTDFEYNVNRENNNITQVAYSYPVYNYYTNKPYNKNENTIQPEFNWDVTPINKKYTKQTDDILLEDYPDNFLDQDVYYRRGRYYREENILLHGKYKISRDGLIVKENEKFSITGRQAENYYFVRGVMIASENAYNKLLALIDDSHNDPNKNNAYYLSAYSRYPITAIEIESLMIGDAIKKLWYKNGTVYSGSFTPKFTERVYKLVKGELVSVTEKGGDASNIFLSALPTEYSDIIDNIEVKPNDCCEIPNADLKTVVDTVYDYANKIVTEEQVKQIPEVFLKFIDCYVYSYLKSDNEKEIETETTLILKDLIVSGQTLTEYLAQYLDHGFATIENIQELFKNDDHEDILFEENRYEFIDFNQKEEFTESVENLDTILEELSKHADDLQTMVNDDAQDIAFTIYNSVDSIKKTMAEIKNKQEYKQLFVK